MSDGKVIEVEGKIMTVLPGTMFRVQLDNGHMVLAHISGKLRKHFIKIAAGDKVKMEMSPYDLDKARITYRIRETNLPPPGPRRPPSADSETAGAHVVSAAGPRPHRYRILKTFAGGGHWPHTTRTSSKGTPSQLNLTTPWAVGACESPQSIREARSASTP